MNTSEQLDADSVPLESFAAERESQSPRLRVGNFKLLVALFVLFMIVVSDFFTTSVLSGFGEKAVKGRTPTTWGVVLQGIFLVIFYILALYLTEHGIL